MTPTTDGMTLSGPAQSVPGDLLDPIVNAKTGLPAAAGKNSATMITNSFLVAAADVGKVTGYTPGFLAAPSISCRRPSSTADRASR